jgi:putative ABC transport system permease protein
MPSERDVIKSGTVIGVFESSEPSADFMLTSMAHTAMPALTIAVQSRTDDASPLVQAIEQAVTRADPMLAVASAGRADRLGGAPVLIARLVVLVATALAATAMLLSVAGLYGVLAEVVSLRMRELGVRIALGASRRRVLLLMVRDGLKPVAEGALVGLAAAVSGRYLIQLTMAEAVPSLTLISAVQILAPLAAVALVACLIPARQALNANPTDLLKDS